MPRRENVGTTLECYEPSGRVPAISIVALVATLLLVAVPIGLLYQGVLELTRIWAIGPLMAALGGMALGLTLSQVLAATRCRNVRVAIASAMFGGALAFAASLYCARWFALATEHSMWQFLTERATSGIGDAERPYTGAVVWTAWTTEFALFVWSAWYIVRYTVARQPYCETCQRWHGREEFAVWQCIDHRPLRAAAREGDWSVLLAPPFDESSIYTTTYLVSACGGCPSAYLSIKIECREKHDPDAGEFEDVRTNVLQYARITTDQLDALVENSRLPAVT